VSSARNSAQEKRGGRVSYDEIRTHAFGARECSKKHLYKHHPKWQIFPSTDSDIGYARLIGQIHVTIPIASSRP